MIEIFTDGASIGNPGLSVAAIIIKENKNVHEYTFPLGIVSNHEAEFLAVIHALEICEQLFPGEIISLRTDSKVVADTIEKEFTKNITFLPLLKKIQELKGKFPLFFVKWIPEKQNKHADQLAKQAVYQLKKEMDQGESNES